MSLSNSVDPTTSNTDYRSLESTLQKLGISREEAAELQGYIKRLLDEDNTFRGGYPIESLLVDRYQKDWKHLRIWRENPIVKIEPVFRKCVEAVRDGVNLSRLPLLSCPPFAPIESSPLRSQPGSEYGSGRESPLPIKSGGNSTNRYRRFNSISSKTTAPICEQERYRQESADLRFQELSIESPPSARPQYRSNGSLPGWNSASGSKPSSFRSPSSYGRSDPGGISRGRKYPPIVERQYSLPVAHPGSRCSSSSRATSPILPSDFCIPPSSLTAPYQPTKASRDFSPPSKPRINEPTGSFTFIEHFKSESSRTRSWYPKPSPVAHSTPSLTLPAHSDDRGLIPTMESTIPTTPRQRIPNRKPVPFVRSPPSQAIIQAPLNLTETHARAMSSPADHRRNYESRSQDPNPDLPTTTSSSPFRFTTLPDLSKRQEKHPGSRGDLVDDDLLCAGKKRDMTPDFEIVPVTRLSPRSLSSEERKQSQHHQSHRRRAREKSRSGVDEHRGNKIRQADKSEEREGGSWKYLVCGCCGDRH
ncbi:hypothetical protein QBC40DRAFT_43940 [Triangularia verruculosa]|uniref:Uncharacterized protein n=1 Tax=Triangularia verruculosa TaxID=2587418 RepID=A0AAN6XR92_9PEZI|nr:hypothetical protein QBC40DRAFT_43940 [Triangularia verruculosa]